MDIRKLKYLETIYRVKSFTKAAEELYISQPSLSNAIHSLEAELGVTLINRTRPPLRFTMAGERFMWHVYRILEDVQEAEAEIAEMAQQRRYSIMLIWPSITANDFILPKIYTQFQSLFPNYQVIVQDDTIQGTMTRLLSEDVDLALVHLPDNQDLTSFAFIPICESSVWVLLPEGHPLAEESEIAFPLLKNETIFTFQPGSLIRRKIQDQMTRANIHPQIVSVNQMDVAKKLVLQGDGISFVTMDNTLMRPLEQDLTLRPLAEPITFQKGFLVKKRKKTAAGISNLIGFVKETVEALRSMN